MAAGKIKTKRHQSVDALFDELDAEDAKERAAGKLDLC
jgi:hypothetical protein